MAPPGRIFKGGRREDFNESSWPNEQGEVAQFCFILSRAGARGGMDKVREKLALFLMVEFWKASRGKPPGQPAKGGVAGLKNHRHKNQKYEYINAMGSLPGIGGHAKPFLRFFSGTPSAEARGGRP